MEEKADLTFLPWWTLTKWKKINLYSFGKEIQVQKFYWRAYIVSLHCEFYLNRSVNEEASIFRLRIHLDIAGRMLIGLRSVSYCDNIILQYTIVYPDRQRLQIIRSQHFTRRTENKRLLHYRFSIREVELWTNWNTLWITTRSTYFKNYFNDGWMLKNVTQVAILYYYLEWIWM